MTSTFHFPLPFSASRFLAVLVAACSLGLATASGGEVPALVDDFSNPDLTSLGAPRLVIDDSPVGGKSQVKASCVDGVYVAEGTITPARGQPGWVSLVLPLAAEGQSADLSAYQGIRLRIRVQQGMLSVSANSTLVDNFDYHGALVPRAGSGITEVRIAFSDMKRGWSEQTKLDPATINSISIVAVGMQPGAFAYELDEVGFY